MLSDCKYKSTETFGMRTYHQYVGESMRRGLKWMRYKRKGEQLSIIDLRLRIYAISTVNNQECADRYERWYKWMKQATTL